MQTRKKQLGEVRLWRQIKEFGNDENPHKEFTQSLHYYIQNGKLTTPEENIDTGFRIVETDNLYMGEVFQYHGSNMYILPYMFFSDTGEQGYLIDNGKQRNLFRIYMDTPQSDETWEQICSMMEITFCTSRPAELYIVDNWDMHKTPADGTPIARNAFAQDIAMAPGSVILAKITTMNHNLQQFPEWLSLDWEWNSRHQVMIPTEFNPVLYAKMKECKLENAGRILEAMDETRPTTMKTLTLCFIAHKYMYMDHVGLVHRGLMHWAQHQEGEFTTTLTLPGHTTIKQLQAKLVEAFLKAWNIITPVSLYSAEHDQLLFQENGLLNVDMYTHTYGSGNYNMQTYSGDTRLINMDKSNVYFVEFYLPSAKIADASIGKYTEILQNGITGDIYQNIHETRQHLQKQLLEITVRALRTGRNEQRKQMHELQKTLDYLQYGEHILSNNMHVV